MEKEAVQKIVVFIYQSIIFLQASCLRFSLCSYLFPGRSAIGGRVVSAFRPNEVSGPDDGEVVTRQGTRKEVTQSLALGTLAPPIFGLNAGKKDVSRRIGSEHVVKIQWWQKSMEMMRFFFFWFGSLV